MTTFNLFVGNGCIEDVVSPSTEGVESLTQYVIATDGVKTVSVGFAQKQDGCPLEFEILVVDSDTGEERPMTPEEASSLSFASDAASKTGTLSVLTGDYALDGQEIEVRLILRSKHSEIPEEALGSGGQ